MSTAHTAKATNLKTRITARDVLGESVCGKCKRHTKGQLELVVSKEFMTGVQWWCEECIDEKNETKKIK
jgi:hypothetical protein